MRTNRAAILVLACAIASACSSGPEPSDVRPATPERAPGPPDLATRFATRVHELDPSLTVVTRDSMHLVVGQIEANLENLAEECRRTPDVCDAALDRYARVVAAPRATATRDRVRAVLVPTAVVDHMLEEDGHGPGERMLGRPFVGPLFESFVLDSDDAIEHMSARGLEELGNPSLDELHELAMTNMRAAFSPTLLSQPFSAEQAPNVRVVTIGDSYENSRILLHERWAEVAQSVEGELLAAAPARDVVLYTGSASATDVATMRWLAQQMVHHEPHPISPAILRWTPERWELYAANEEEDPSVAETIRQGAMRTAP